MIDAQMLGMIVSQMIFEMFGFGPSRSICDEFAEKVIQEAESVNYRIEVPE